VDNYNVSLSSTRAKHLSLANSSDYDLFNAGIALSIPFSSASWLLLLPHCVLSVFLDTSRPETFDDQIKRAAITAKLLRPWK